MFQAGGLVVVLVEVGRKAYLASIVPVIVNSILNEHQIVVDIVAFVNRGDFPRSRLGEKQRGKILAGWVSRKMRTVAQFAIRDMDAASMDQGPGPDGSGSPGDANRASMGSLRNSSGAGLGMLSGTTLRNMEPAPQILEQRELEQQLENMASLPPTGLAEMPADEMRGSSGGGFGTGAGAGADGLPPPRLQSPGLDDYGGGPDSDNTTPTKTRMSFAASPPPVNRRGTGSR